MRPFTPPRIGYDPALFVRLVEDRLQAMPSSQYVRHLPSGGTPQWVVMNYQYLPEPANISPDFKIPGKVPSLWGHREHFEVVPSVFTKGNSVRPDSGSKFEVQGFMFLVKGVEINHAGMIRLDIARDDKCMTARPEFDEEWQALLCQPPECPPGA